MTIVQTEAQSEEKFDAGKDGRSTSIVNPSDIWDIYEYLYLSSCRAAAAAARQVALRSSSWSDFFSDFNSNDSVRRLKEVMKWQQMTGSTVIIHHFTADMKEWRSEVVKFFTQHGGRFMTRDAEDAEENIIHVAHRVCLKILQLCRKSKYSHKLWKIAQIWPLVVQLFQIWFIVLLRKLKSRPNRKNLLIKV